jgi:hypothetical protein
MKLGRLNHISVTILIPNFVIARSVETKQSRVAHSTLDCFASFAMTGWGCGVTKGDVGL